MKILFFFPVLLLSYCKPTAPVTPDTPSTPKLVWQTALGERGSSIHPIISGDYVVFSNQKNTTPVTEPLKILNKQTGKFVGEWSDILGTNGNIYDSQGKGIYENNGIVILPLGSSVHGIDIKNNKTLWKNKDSDTGEEAVTGLGNTIFHTKYKMINGVESGYIAQSNTLTGKWQTVFTDTILSDYKNYLQTPIPFIDKNNDTLLFIVQTKYRFPPQERNTNNLYCYNLSKKRLNYKVEITQPVEGTSLPIVLQPQIESDKIVIRAGGRLICFNIYTGDKKWEVNANGQTGTNNSWDSFTLGNGKVFGYASSQTVLCYDLETGTQQWKLSTPKSGNLVGEMTYFNGFLYYSTGGLEALKASTGERVWNYEGPEQEFFTTAMRVDKVASKIYISDFKGNRYCYEALK